MTYYNSHDETLPFTGMVPAALARYKIPGSIASGLENEYGRFLSQEMDSPSCRAFHTVYQIQRPENLHIGEEGPFLFTLLTLQFDRKLDIDGIGPVHMKEGQFNIVYSPHFDLHSRHEDRKEYISLSIEYRMDVLQEWAGYFPILASFLEKVQAGLPATMLNENGWLTKEMQDITYKVLHCPLDTPAYRAYFDLLAKELLFHLLLQSVQRDPPSAYSHYEVEGIHAAREMIRKNIRYHFVIREIAQKVGMNEFKLKNGFREIFGNGVYEYLRIERMQEARNLLSERGRSVKEVAALTGYKSVNSFIKAFKKKFSLTPGEFRKRA